MVFDVKYKPIGSFTHKQYTKIKGAADNFNQYFNLINDLGDEDQRDVAIAKQAFDLLIKSGEKLLGCGLSDHPVLALHEAHFEVLWMVFAAYNQKQNTRALMDKAISIVDKVRRDSNDLCAAYRKEYNHLCKRIGEKLKGYPYEWNKYVTDLRREGFGASSRQDIIDECHFIMYTRIPQLWTMISREVEELQSLTRGALVDYAAIKSYCHTIERLVCKYDGKVRAMRRSKKSIDRIAGNQLWKQQALDRVPNGQHSKKARRIAAAKADPAAAAREAAESAEHLVWHMTATAEQSKTLYILGIGISGGVDFPWDIARRRKGIHVPMLPSVNVPNQVRKMLAALR